MNRRGAAVSGTVLRVYRSSGTIRTVVNGENVGGGQECDHLVVQAIVFKSLLPNRALTRVSLYSTGSGSTQSPTATRRDRMSQQMDLH